MIEFQNVSYTHSKGKGVTNLTFSIDDGEFVFLIGPTGSGKTTLMRIIARYLLPDAGTLNFRKDQFLTESFDSQTNIVFIVANGMRKSLNLDRKISEGEISFN